MFKHFLLIAILLITKHTHTSQATSQTDSDYQNTIDKIVIDHCLGDKEIFQLALSAENISEKAFIEAYRKGELPAFCVLAEIKAIVESETSRR